MQLKRFDVDLNAALEVGRGLHMRRAAFGDVPPILDLIKGAIALGCRGHYDQAQRQAVFETYASCLFVDVLSPMETIVLETQDVAGQHRKVIAVGQLDPARARLRGLFVSANRQGQGLGRLMLSAIESVAASHGLPQLEGAMSLNAQGFYRHAGFAPVRPVQLSQIFGVSVPVQLMRKDLQNAVGG